MAPSRLGIGGWDASFVLTQLALRIEEKVNLLLKGEKVLFYKRKKGEEVRYSRQATQGICLPTDISPCPERWREVSNPNPNPNP